MSKSKEYIPYGFVQSTQKEKGFYQLLTLLSTLFSWKLSSIEKVKELLITNSRKLERKVDEMILKLEREKEEAIKPYLDNFLEAKKIFDEKWEEAKKKYYNFIMMAKEEKREAEKVATEAFNELNRIEEEIRKRFKGQEKTYKVKKLLHL